jgi:hypothetical protein
MARLTGVENVFRQVVCALSQTKPASRHNDVRVAAHGADRAVAILNFKRVGQIHLEAYRVAMAPT